MFLDWRGVRQVGNRYSCGLILLLSTLLAGCGSASDTDAFLSAVKYDELPQVDAAIKKISSRYKGVNRANADGIDGLMVAAARGRADIVERLIVAGAKPAGVGGKGSTALMFALRQARSLDVVNALMRAGADVNATDSEGNSVAWYALWQPHESDDDDDLIRQIRPPHAPDGEISASDLYFPEDDKLRRYRLPRPGEDVSTIAPVFATRLSLLTTLVDAGADLRVLNNDRASLLMRAVRANDIDVVRFLLKKGLDVNSRNRFGSTALQYISYNIDAPSLDARIAKELLAAGASVDAVDMDGSATLALAANRGRLELMKVLLSARANVNLEDHEGRSASVKATPEARDLLLKAGAEVGDQAALMASWDLNECASKGLSNRRMIQSLLNVIDEFYKKVGKANTDSALWYGLTASRSECKGLANLKLGGMQNSKAVSLEQEGLPITYYGVSIVCKTENEQRIVCEKSSD
ncbi:ankyrin repeat domain-containing protein [Burkholderia stagnalis]